MDERLKAGPGLRRDIQKEDAQKDLDTQSKNLFKYRPILAVILHLCVPEFKDMTPTEVVDCIEKGTISISEEVSEGETVKQDNSESKPNNEKTLYFDIVFSVLIPKTNSEISVGLKIDLEVQKTLKSLGYPLENRGIYYLSRLISSQLNYVDDDTDYGVLRKVYSIWICTSDIFESEKNSVVRYRMIGEKVYGKDFPIPNADLLEMIVIKLGDITSFKVDENDTSDDILEFLYGVFAYHTHPEYFSKYIDLDNAEDSESIRKELDAMSGTGQILLQEGRAEMEELVVKAGQLRDEGITDIEEYRKEGISDIIYNVVLGIKPNN